MTKTTILYVAERFDIRLRDTEFARQCELLGATTEVERALLIGMSARTLHDARRYGRCSGILIAQILGVLGRHRQCLVAAAHYPEFDHLFEIVVRS